MSTITRNRTCGGELAFLMRLLPELKGATPARVELTVTDQGITAMVMADRLKTPLVASGATAPLALRALVDEVDRLARENTRKRQRRRTDA